MGAKPRREQTIILGDRPVTLTEIEGKPVTFTSRKEIKQYLKKHGVWSPYFSDMVGGR